MLFKSILATIAVSSYSVNAVPAYHRNDDFTLNHHKSLDEINVVDGSTCPCGTHPIFNGSGAVTACQPLECSLDCGSSCTNSFALDGHTSSDTDDVHHLGRHNKVCRFNNDASCHSCPTSSCQYPVGNFYGSGFPCKHIEGSQTTFAGLNFDATDSNGIGQTITLASGYNNGQSETIEFCSSDEYEIGLLNCGVDKLGLIVSPKTCTHCQIARCVNIADAWRYLDWNAADIKALFNSAGEYIGTAGKHQVAESTHHPKLSSSVTIPADGFCATGGLLGDNNNCAGCGNACTNGEVCFHNLFCMCPYGSLDDDNNCGTCGTKCGNSNTVCVMFNGSPSCNCPSGELGDRNNCGYCGNACANGVSCSGGYCQDPCANGVVGDDTNCGFCLEDGGVNCLSSNTHCIQNQICY